MAFPNDLANVVVFKIHPAIGIARVSKNPDHFIFGTDPANYKSNRLLKRQAVQFRIFAYGPNHVGLGELTRQVMGNLGITAVWSAKVANRKIAKIEGLPLEGAQHVISAVASSNANDGKLVGTLPDFLDGAAIPLGQITGEGLFIPPTGGVHRKTAGQEIEPYPAESTLVADTSCDGSISVRLAGVAVDVLPACIIVTAPDLSPDTREGITLNDYLRDKLGTPSSPPPQNLHNETAATLDKEALLPATARFNPGIEVSLGDRTEVIDIRSIFYRNSQNPKVDPREVRVRYKAGAGDVGAVPGQLTSGLCSTWQGDYMACVGYWVEHLPPQAYLDEDTNQLVQMFRKTYADFSGDELATGDDFEQHIDKMGVARLINGKKVETERNPGDDV